MKNNLFPFIGNNESTSNLQTASSSTNQSPLIGYSLSHQVSHSSITNVNSTNDDDSSQHQQQSNSSWATGTSNKVARIANRIVDSIASISTPKQPHRQINPQETQAATQQQKPILTNLNEKPRNNVVESISSSSCNSSEPNSPNNLKPYNPSGVYYPNSMNSHHHHHHHSSAHQTQSSNSRLENEKKSSTSSIASSIGTHASSSNSSSNKLLLPLTNQSGPFAQNSVYNSNNNLSPNPALYSTRSPSSVTKPGEFFPSTTTTMSSTIKTDINNNNQLTTLDTNANSSLNNSQLKNEFNTNATDEAHNTLTNDDSNLNPSLDDEFNSTKQTINEGDYDPNDGDITQSSVISIFNLYFYMS